jgi:hypothetical protein
MRQRQRAKTRIVADKRNKQSASLGLSTIEAARRLRLHGANALPEVQPVFRGRGASQIALIYLVLLPVVIDIAIRFVEG